MSRNQVVVILSLITVLCTVFCAVAFAALVLSQAQGLSEALSLVRQASSTPIPIIATPPPKVPAPTPPAPTIATSPPPIPGPTKRPSTSTPPGFVSPTSPRLSLGTPQASKCDQPNLATTMAQAMNGTTSIRAQVKASEPGIEFSGTFEQAREGASTNAHFVYYTRNTQGITQTLELILTPDSIWEKRPDGTWSPSQIGTSTVGMIGSSRSPIPLHNIVLQGKAGSTLYANRPAEVYWITMANSDEQGTLYVDSKSCLPLFMSTGIEAKKVKSSMTFEWNIPLKITPPKE